MLSSIAENDVNYSAAEEDSDGDDE